MFQNLELLLEVLFLICLLLPEMYSEDSVRGVSLKTLSKMDMSSIATSKVTLMLLFCLAITRLAQRSWEG